MKKKTLSRIVSFVSAVVMIVLFTVNAFADTLDVKYKYYYSDTSYMMNEANQFKVDFTVYMKPVVQFSNENKPAEIIGVYAYVTIEWSKAEALPKPYSDMTLVLSIVQSYQPELHYSVQKLKKTFGGATIKNLLEESVRTSTGYKYTSKVIYGTPFKSSVITDSNSQYYNPNGFLNWTQFEVMAELVPRKEILEYTPDTYVVRDYSTIISDCRNQL